MIVVVLVVVDLLMEEWLVSLNIAPCGQHCLHRFLKMIFTDQNTTCELVHYSLKELSVNLT